MGLGSINRPAGVGAEFVNGGSREIELARERFPAWAGLWHHYDPKGMRARG